jgi:hypothetical protein
MISMTAIEHALRMRVIDVVDDVVDDVVVDACDDG